MKKIGMQMSILMSVTLSLLLSLLGNALSGHFTVPGFLLNIFQLDKIADPVFGIGFQIRHGMELQNLIRKANALV